MSFFYSHIISFESLIISLEELNLSAHHKKVLTSLIDDTAHKAILGLILSKLSPTEKIEFLRMVNQNPRDGKIIDYLNSKASNIESEIRRAAEQLKKELHQDIQRSKRLGSQKNKLREEG